MDPNEQYKLQMYINDLLHTLNQKDEAIEKAAKVIELMKSDFERVVKDLRRTERDKDSLLKEQKSLEKEFANTRRDLNQVDNLKKMDEKHKVLYNQQKDKNENLIIQFQERDEQSNQQIDQLQEEITSLQEMMELKNYELESQIHQYKVKETGFSNALQSLQDKEDVITQQDLQIKELLSQQDQVNQNYTDEILTLKRLAENFYRNDQKQPSGLKKIKIESNIKRRNRTPTKMDDEATLDEDSLNDKLVLYKNELTVQSLVNQLILDQKGSLDSIRKKLGSNQDFNQFDKEMDRFIVKFSNGFNKFNELFLERNNLNILLKDFQSAYDQLKENHESFVQSIKISMLRIEKSYDDDDFVHQMISNNSSSIQLILAEQMPRLIEVSEKRKDELKKLRLDNKQNQEVLKAYENDIQEANLALQHYKQIYSEDYQLKQIQQSKGQVNLNQKLESKFESVDDSLNQIQLIEDLQCEVEELKNINKNLQRDLMSRQDDQLIGKYKNALRSIEDFQQMNKSLLQHNEMLKQEISIKEEEVQQSSQDNDKEELQEQNQNLMEQLNQLTQDHAQTVDMFDKALNDLEELQMGDNDNNQQNDQRLNELKELLSLSQQNETNLEQQVYEYKLQLKELENHCLQMQNDLQSQDQIIKELQNKIKQYKFELQESENRVNYVGQEGIDFQKTINPLLDIYLSTQMNNYEQLGSTNKLYVYQLFEEQSGNSFESFGRMGEHLDSAKDGTLRYTRNNTTSRNQSQLMQKIVVLQDQVSILINSQYHLIDTIIFLLKDRKQINKNETQMLLDFDNDFKLFKNQSQQIGLVNFVSEFSEINQLFLHLVGSLLANIKEGNNGQNKTTDLVKKSQRNNSEFHSGQIEMMTRFIQCIHQIAQKYLESVGRGDKPIVDRLEQIVKKYKSLGNNVLAKRSLTLLSSTCHILLQVFKLWKDHVINVSEILFEVGEGARQITLNNQYDEDHMQQRFKKFEKKIQDSLQLIEKDTFASRIDQNLMQIEIVADKIQNTTFEAND